MNKIALELKRLQEKATTVNGYIREVKSMIKDSRFRCEKYSPIDIDDIPMFYISKECWDWDEDCEPSGQQKYYAFLLYYRKVLKEIEKQIRIKKKLLKVHNKESKVKTEETPFDDWHYIKEEPIPKKEGVIYYFWFGGHHFGSGFYAQNTLWKLNDTSDCYKVTDIQAWKEITPPQMDTNLTSKVAFSSLWHYPSKNDFPPFEKVVYIWDDGRLWRGHYHRYVKDNVEHKWWEVYNKGGIESMQDEVEAWAPLDSIEPPEEVVKGESTYEHQ